MKYKIEFDEDELNCLSTAAEVMLAMYREMLAKDPNEESLLLLQTWLNSVKIKINKTLGIE
jgi:hypothetical protein